MDWLVTARWSPYAAGIGIGILSWLTLVLSDKPIGCSTAFARTSGMIERLFRGRKVLDKAYYKEFAPRVDWEWMLVVGIILGAFTSAKLSGQFKLDWVPSLWAGTFGPGPVARVAVAFCGGILLGFGARWAGGCTSGHGISGTLQLAVSSWLAAICFFAGGIAAAFLIFRVLG
ncbi:MAG: YeeE/YedE family protein [Candidatus Aminicenantes bacterium]|nr:YeeE/YedE family protein [Candidatus Aminicenantes bacterium]